MGSLFYWAWAHAETKTELGLHPHQGFEIMTYGIAGRSMHKDTLGTESILEAGDIQLMQTGSGVSHAEGIDGGFEGFQIWFEPYLNDAVKRSPAYNLFKDKEFPITELQGAKVKTILGNNSPVNIVTDAQMIDLEVDPQSSYTYRLLPGRTLAGLVIRGDGMYALIGQKAASFSHKDFLIFQTEDEDEITFQAGGEKLRIALIELPTNIDYPLYQKRR
ncbi:pirin family protein [Paenibacillus wynnii]|uniref:pirin family protein n=1 Tax=Paenibacillus wynnii TaxID=268407 RepID=UPI00278D0F1B|nr:pirin family protein [Paenibacillus wynnii]MDQ0193344.1 redox-sensitive bicupin YhaK (pirin superfamily) [Paenibacillus wynnii]